MDEIDRIINDVHDVNIVLNAVNAHGKTSSLRTIIGRLKQQNPKAIVKIFDISQAWFHNAPVKRRQRITPEVLIDKRYLNVNDCVYEIGSLPPEYRRYFIAVIVGQDYQSRYNLGIDHPQAVADLPRIFYVFEEATNYFGSWSLKRKDESAPILYDFVTVGRNYGLRAFLVVNREIGSLSTDIRDTAPKILGHIEAKSDLRYYKSRDKRVYELIKSMPKYHWVYCYRGTHGPFRIGDEVERVPDDYTYIQPRIAVEKDPFPWWTVWVFLVLLAFLLGAYLSWESRAIYSL